MRPCSSYTVTALRHTVAADGDQDNVTDEEGRGAHIKFTLSINTRPGTDCTLALHSETYSQSTISINTEEEVELQEQPSLIHIVCANNIRWNTTVVPESNLNHIQSQ